MDKDYILLDLDGTLIDPKEGITNSVQHSLRALGIEACDRDELLRFIGPPLRDSYRVFYGFDEVKAELAVAKYREYFAVAGILENTLYPGVPELLRELQVCGKTVALATSKPWVYAEKILESYGLREHFSFIAGSELDGARSRKSELIRYALDNVGCSDLGRAVMVGDREHDVIGANEIGIESVGVLYGYGSENELRNANTTYIARNVDELCVVLCGTM